MRVTRNRRLLIIAGLFIVALAFFAVRFSRKPTVTASDGTILTLQKISYGKREPFRPDAWRYRFQTLIDHLPGWLSSHLPNLGGEAAWSGGELPMPAEDALYAWFTRYDPRSGKDVDNGLYSAEIVDEHGCRFIAAQCGGTARHQGAGVRGYEVGWAAFQAFPRRLEQFRLRLYDRDQKLVGEFVVPNPALFKSTDWKPEPLPITRSDVDLSFTLKSLSLHDDATGNDTNSNRLQPPPSITPEFEIRENGNATKEWQIVQTDMFDSTGNRPSRWPFKAPFLCPFEPAWKLRVKFCGSENSPVASNACWTMRHLNLPSPGSFTALSVTQQLQGATLRLMGLAGAGHTSYSNDVPVRAQPFSGVEKGDYSESSSASGTAGRMDTANNIEMPLPHVAVAVSGLNEDQWLSVQASDDKGGKFFAKIWEWDLSSGGFKETTSPYVRLGNSARYFFGLDIPGGVNAFDLTICLHTARTAEFVVKPPNGLR